MLPLLAPWVELVWSQPNCEVCGGDCVLASDSDLKVGCYNYNVQSRSGGSSSGTVAEYGISPPSLVSMVRRDWTTHYVDVLF
ncbi:hypothetical protein CFP56_007851 [Quercus suber]|uniref:Secreted protein n=1 Tax=Quercus suber TaxID=58331 RepID=A0AAW0L7R5_QUESU